MKGFLAETPMPIEPVKIPQNVYVEDRIVGPITLRQLIILGLGAGLSYVLYGTATKTGPVSLPLTIALWSPTLVAAAFAFLRVNDLSLFNIILLMIEHANKPSQRVWSQHPGISIAIITHAASNGETEKTHQKNAAQAARLSEMARQLERQQAELSQIIAEGQSLQKQPPPTKEPQANIDGIQTAQEVPHATVATETDFAPLTVDRSRVSAQPLVPHQSIDGLAPSLNAYNHLFTEPSQ